MQYFLLAEQGILWMGDAVQNHSLATWLTTRMMKARDATCIAVRATFVRAQVAVRGSVEAQTSVHPANT
jgi:hypothetical protein